MKDEYIPLDLVYDKSGHRFEMKVGDYTAFIEALQSQDKITLLHTEVPPELEGKGAATAIIEKTLAFIEQHQYTMVPQCTMVMMYIKRHPEWKRILDKGVKAF